MEKSRSTSNSTNSSFDSHDRINNAGLFSRSKESFFSEGEKNDSFFPPKPKINITPNIQAKCNACEEKENQEEIKTDETPDIQSMPAFESDVEPVENRLQTKLKIGKPNDHYEREADAMAESFINAESRRQNGNIEFSKSDTGSIHTKRELPKVPEIGEQAPQNVEHQEEQKKVEETAAEKTNEAEAKGKGAKEGPKPQIDLPEKKETKDKTPPELQQKSKQEEGSDSNIPEGFKQSLSASKGKGESLAPNVQAEMGEHFDRDFSQVKVHSGSDAIKMNETISSRAFTNENDIYFNKGEYNTESTEGRKLLAHELTHTIQQDGAKQNIQRASFPAQTVTTQGKAPKPNDGAEVEGKAGNNIDNDDRVKDQEDLSEEEKQEKKKPDRGEVKSERNEVNSEGVSTPSVDRGAEAQEKTTEQKAELEGQLSEESAEGKNKDAGGANGEEANTSDADAANQRAKAATQKAQSIKIPDEPEPFKQPRIEGPVDSAGKALPRNPQVDTQVRGLGMIGEMLRTKGYEMKKHASEQEIHSHGLDAVLEELRGDLANAQEGASAIESHNEERKDISQKSKDAHQESSERQQFVAAEAPKLAQKAKEGSSDSGALASDSQSKADKSKSETPDDPDARADAEKQSSEMSETAEGAKSMDDAIQQTGQRAEQYQKEAEKAAQDNAEAQAKISETDQVISQLDGRIAEMHGKNAESSAKIENAGPGPEKIREFAKRSAESGDEVIAASIVMEQELNALQEEYLSNMASIESKEEAEKKAKEKQEQAQNQQMPPEEQEVIEIATAEEKEKEERLKAKQSDPAAQESFMATIEKMISKAPDKGTDETEGARLKVDTGLSELLVGTPEADPRQEQIQQVENKRIERVSGVLDIADQNMDKLSAEQQAALANSLVAQSISDDVKNIDVLQMGKEMLKGMVNPGMALQGVVGGFEKFAGGLANIGNLEAWKKDPLGNLLQIAADISTGLAMIFSSILGIAGMITALMVALTILSWGTLSPITGPVIGWMGTVMTYAGWGAIISGGLSVYFNYLAYIKNLHDASTATTARELFGNVEQMKQNASDGFQGAMAVVEGVGAVKMGPKLSSGKFFKDVPRSPGQFAKNTVKGAKDGIAKIKNAPANIAKGAKKLFSKGKKGLADFKNKVKSFFSKSKKGKGGGDLDLEAPKNNKAKQKQLDQSKSKSTDELADQDINTEVSDASSGRKLDNDPDFDVEIEVNGHKYKRRRDGKGWCRFSPGTPAQACSLDPPDGANAKLKDIGDDVGGKKTKKQREFDDDIQQKLDDGEIKPAQAQKLRDFNNKHGGRKRPLKEILDDLENPDKVLGPDGRFRSKSGKKKKIEIDDATRKKTEANRLREGKNDTPDPGTPEHQRLKDQKDVAERRIKDAEAEIDNLSDPKNKSQEAKDYRKAREESFQKRHPEAEARKKFNEEYDNRPGVDPNDPRHIKKREKAFKQKRHRDRLEHQKKYDRGKKNAKKGDAFEDARVEQLNAELEERLGRKLNDDEKFVRRTPAQQETLTVDGKKVSVAPDLEVKKPPPGGFIESKSGRLTATPEVEDQIIRYAQLAQKTGKKVTYELLGGASQEVLDMFKKYGVDYIDFTKL